MIIRPDYINAITPYIDTPLVKILAGVRRCGKSTILEMMKEEYDRRRKYLVKALNEIGLPCPKPEGAFYVFMQVGHYGLSSEEFCERLLEEQQVAIVPGNAFGQCGEGYARLSYAYSLEHLKEAVKRMDKFVQSLKK